MEGARVLMRDGVPSIVSYSSRLKSLSYIYNEYQNHKHLADANEDIRGQLSPLLSSRQNAHSKPLPTPHPCNDYSINVNKGEPTN
jgi:hypothetical protein